ncbi:MAG TPA: alcohol dehydrogenase family protein [Steroidobacteraceae bacterium]|nr:alcohol dehydrogenase family protein [Steroidobacteraceae bacterium]
MSASAIGPPLAETMLAVLLKGHGDFDQLELRTVPVPVPRNGEVLVRIAAAAVNNTDINTRIGWYSRTATPLADSNWTGAAFHFPRIQGADGCGHIAAVGPGVAASRVGERVLIDPILRGGRADGADAAYLGADRDGAFAQFTVVPAANACAVQSTLSDIELASFPCSYLAAEHMLSRAAVGPADTIVVTGASGGVGSAAVQLGRHRKARVIAVSGPDKEAPLRELGAERVLARDADLSSLLGRASVDVVIDCVGGAQFPQLLQILRRGGRYAVAGAIGGAIVELDLRTVYLQDLSLYGCTIPGHGLFAQLLRLIERGEIRPLISATYPLRDIVAAQQAFLQKRHIGKIVLVP